MLNRRAVRFALLVSGVLGVFVVVLLIQEQSIFGKRRRYSAPAEASASTSPVPADTGKSDASGSSLAVQGVRIVAMSTLAGSAEKVKSYSINIGETIGAVGKHTKARNVEVQIFNKKRPDEERVVAIVKGDDATITFVDPPDVAKGFSGAQIETLELQNNVVVDYLNEAGAHAAKLETDELQLAGGGERFYVPRRAIIDQQGTHIEGDGLRYAKAGGAFSFEKNVLVEGSSFKLPSAADVAAATEDESVPGALRRITCSGPFTYVPTPSTDEHAGSSEQPKIKSGVLTFKDNVVGSQEETKLTCDVLEITLDSSKTSDDADDGSGTKITKVVATGVRERPARLVDVQGSFIGEVLSMEKTELGDVIVLKNDARIENAKLGSTTADATAAPGQPADLLNAAAKTLIRVEPLALESPDAPQRMKILLRDAGYLAIASPVPEKSFRVDGEEIDVFVVKAPAEDGGAAKMKLERLSARVRARGEFSKGTFTADEITVRPKDGATDPSDSEIELKPNPRIDLAMPGEGGGKSKVVVIGTNCVAVIQPPVQDGGAIQAHFEGKNTLTVDENDVRTLTMDANRSLTVVAPGQGAGETTVTAVGDVAFASDQKDVHGNGETVVLRILEDDSKQVSILAADKGPLARVTLIDADHVGNEIRGKKIDFDPKTNVLDARGSVHAVMPAKMLGVADANASSKKTAKAGPSQPGTLDCEHLVVNVPVKDKATGETPQTLVLEATEHARYVDPEQGVVATGHRLVFEQATGLATAYGDDDEPALILRSGDDPKVKVQDQVGVGGNIVIMDKATETLTCPDRGSVVIVQPTDAQDVRSALQTTRARSSGPVKYMNKRLVLRQNVAVTFEQDGIEDRVLHCDKLTVTFKSKDDADASADVSKSVSKVEKLLAEGRVLFEQAGPREVRAGGDIAEWTPDDGGNFVVLRAPSPLCWAETVGPGPEDFGRYDGTWVRINLKTQDLSTGPGLFVTKTPPKKQK